jgi:hypothetical protein
MSILLDLLALAALQNNPELKLALPIKIPKMMQSLQAAINVALLFLKAVDCYLKY